MVFWYAPVLYIFFTLYNELESHKIGVQTEKWAIFDFFSLTKCEDLRIVRRERTKGTKNKV